MKSWGAAASAVRGPWWRWGAAASSGPDAVLPVELERHRADGGTVGAGEAQRQHGLVQAQGVQPGRRPRR